MNPVNENAFVDESIKSRKPNAINVSTFVDISFICDYFHIGDTCRISPVLYDKIIRPYESRKKKIVTDIIFDYESLKRSYVDNPEEVGVKNKHTVFKGMYFTSGYYVDFKYPPWNYLDRCILPPVDIAVWAQKVVSPEKKETRHVVICTAADCRRGFIFETI